MTTRDHHKPIQTVLLVDDSDFARRMERLYLEEAGYLVEEAADGIEALERYYLKRHDLVILDNVMPLMPGLEVLEKLREMDPAACVIMVTSDVQAPTRTEALRLGAAGYVNKPLKKEAVLPLIARVLDSGDGWGQGGSRADS